MVNNAHVFVVDATTFPVHRDRLFCGVKNPINENTRCGLYADIFGVKPGDLIFFYQRRIDEPRQERGFRGIYKAASAPFFDKKNVKGVGDFKGLTVRGTCPECRDPHSRKNGQCPNCGAQHSFHILPNRILIEPVKYFVNPVDDNTAYINHTNHGMLWTMLFRKTSGAGRARSITHILPEEAEKLLRLLDRKNPAGPVTKNVFERYIEPQSIRGKEIKLILGRGPDVKYESALEAWLMQNIDKEVPVLSEVVGPKKELEYFGNNVLYGIGGDKVDILCLHKKGGARYKATVIELKKGRVSDDALYQIEDYAFWVAQLSTANLSPGVRKLEIQPLLIGRGATASLQRALVSFKTNPFQIPLETKCNVVVKKPILLEYAVSKNNIYFEKVLK